MKTVIRPATAGDLLALTASLNYPWGDPAKHRRYLEQQERGDATYLVAWAGDRPLGHALAEWGGGLEQLPGCPTISDVMVLEEHRSRGIGRRLLETAERLAVRRGHERVGLWVGLDNLRAASLYRRCGYEDADLEPYTKSWTLLDERGREQCVQEMSIYLVKRLVAP